MAEQIYSRKALARRWGVSLATIDRSWRSGHMPAPIRVSPGRLGFKASEIEAFEVQQTRTVVVVSRARGSST